MENKDDKDPFLSEIKKLDTNVKRILWIGAPILILMPILATQLDWFFDFTHTGSIGDTIGGVTAPVIGGVSALLIYFSFRAQINSNRIIINQMDGQVQMEKERRDQNHLMEIYFHLRNSIDSFQYNLDGRNIKTGRSAFHDYWGVILSGRESAQKGSSKSFKNILELFEVLIDELRNYSNKKTDIKLVLFMTKLQFDQCIWESYSEGITKGTVDPAKSKSLSFYVNVINKIESKIEELKTPKKLD